MDSAERLRRRHLQQQQQQQQEVLIADPSRAPRSSVPTGTDPWAKAFEKLTWNQFLVRYVNDPKARRDDSWWLENTPKLGPGGAVPASVVSGLGKMVAGNKLLQSYCNAHVPLGTLSTVEAKHPGTTQKTRVMVCKAPEGVRSVFSRKATAEQRARNFLDRAEMYSELSAELLSLKDQMNALSLMLKRVSATHLPISDSEAKSVTELLRVMQYVLKHYYKHLKICEQFPLGAQSACWDSDKLKRVVSKNRELMQMNLHRAEFILSFYLLHQHKKELVVQDLGWYERSRIAALNLGSYINSLRKNQLVMSAASWILKLSMTWFVIGTVGLAGLATAGGYAAIAAVAVPLLVDKLVPDSWPVKQYFMQSKWIRWITEGYQLLVAFVTGDMVAVGSFFVRLVLTECQPHVTSIGVMNLLQNCMDMVITPVSGAVGAAFSGVRGKWNNASLKSAIKQSHTVLLCSRFLSSGKQAKKMTLAEFEAELHKAQAQDQREAKSQTDKAFVPDKQVTTWTQIWEKGKAMMQAIWRYVLKILLPTVCLISTLIPVSKTTDESGQERSQTFFQKKAEEGGFAPNVQRAFDNPVTALVKQHPDVTLIAGGVMVASTFALYIVDFFVMQRLQPSEDPVQEVAAIERLVRFGKTQPSLAEGTFELEPEISEQDVATQPPVVEDLNEERFWQLATTLLRNAVAEVNRKIPQRPAPTAAK